jgi:hypothetical protein
MICLNACCACVGTVDNIHPLTEKAFEKEVCVSVALWFWVFLFNASTAPSRLLNYPEQIRLKSGAGGKSRFVTKSAICEFETMSEKSVFHEKSSKVRMMNCPDPDVAVPNSKASESLSNLISSSVILKSNRKILLLSTSVKDLTWTAFGTNDESGKPYSWTFHQI